jgi:phage-related protein (TIGR01555 family)
MLTSLFKDGFQNLLSSIGMGGRDKGAVSTSYVIRSLTYAQIDAAYRSDWIVRKAIDIPADDATREWRSWQADKKDITALEETEKLIKVQSKMRRAMKLGRFIGGGALMMGTDDEEDMTLPLNLKKVKKDSLKFLHPVSRNQLATGTIVQDVASEWYGRPEYYEQRYIGAATTPFQQGVRFHPSRVIPFYGAERLNAVEFNEAWSDPILQVIDDAVKGAGLVSANIAHMISEAKVDIIKVPDLTEAVSTEEGQKRLTERFTYANTAKSVINALLLDKEEEWQRIQVEFQGMPDVLQVYLLIACAAVDVPSTRFLSQSPKGLSATGESDIRNYYDSCRSKQTNEVTPTISPLDEIVIRSTLGTMPDGIHYNWRPLWQATEAEKATTAYSKAQTFQIDVNSMLFNEDALRQGRQNQLIEDGTYPGFEDAIDEFGAEPDEPEVDPALLAAQKLLGPSNSQQKALPPARKALPAPRRSGDSVRIGDSLPSPLYVHRDLTAASASKVREWAIAQGFPAASVLTDMRVTIIYSREPVNWMSLGSDDWGGDADLVVPAGGPRVMEKFGEGAIVLSFASNRLQYRHESMCAQGASHDYAEYQPHLTIANGVSIDIRNIDPYRGELRFGPEMFEAISKSYDPNDPPDDDDEDDTC